MRKYIICLAAMVLASFFAGSVASAQEAAQEQQAVKPYKVYCEIISTAKFFSNKSTVELDFGQFAGFWSGDRQLVDEQGDSGTPHYHWVLSKMVTDDSQITEGLRTKGMNK